MVLAQKQKYRSMEQDRKPRDKPSHICSNYFQQVCQEHSMRKGQSLQQMVLGKLDTHMQINEIGPLYYTTHKIQLKVD